MVYNLSETEQYQIEAWLSQIPELYHEVDAVRLNDILMKALAIGYLDEDAVYELLELLPKMIPEEPDRMRDVSEDGHTDWQEYMNGQRIRYKREMNRFRQSLSSRIFLQNAAYQKHMHAAGKSPDRPVIVGNGMIKRRRTDDGKIQQRQQGCLSAANQGRQR